MPIKGLTNQAPEFPQIGELRKGAPKPESGNAPGKDLTYFRFTSDLPEVVAAFESAYDGEPRLINAFLPFRYVDENWDAWQEAWVAGGLKHRCDGEYVVRILGDDGAYTDPEPGTVKCPGGCKPSGRLKILIPELRRLASVLVLTTSLWDIHNLDKQLRALYEIKQDLRGIPLQLRRRKQRKSMPKGNKRVRRDMWLLSIEAAPTYVELQLAAQEAAALPQLPETVDAPEEVTIDGATGEIVGDGEWPDELFEAGEDAVPPDQGVIGMTQDEYLEGEPDFIPPPDFLVVQIPAGPRKGQRIGWLLDNDPDYLELVAQGAKNMDVRNAALAAIEWGNEQKALEAQAVVSETAEQMKAPL